MAHPEPEKLKILIDINLNLAAGLNTKPDKEERKIVPLPVAKRLAQTSIQVVVRTESLVSGSQIHASGFAGGQPITN